MSEALTTMETEPKIRLRPSVDRIDTNTERLRSPAKSPVRTEAPVFRDPAWSAGDTSPKTVGPVLLQPAMDEANMAQRDKALLNRLDGGSISSSESSIRSHTSSPDSLRKKLPDPTRRLSTAIAPIDTDQAAAPLAPPQHARSKLAPEPIKTTSAPAHGPRLPSLVRLVGNDKHDRRRLSRTQAIQSPLTPRSPAFSPFTPVQMVPVPMSYGWNPMAMGYPMQQMSAQAQAQVQAQAHAQAAQAQAMAQARANAQAQAQAKAQPKPAATFPELREDLWKVGSRYMSLPQTADVYVRAVDVRRGSTSAGHPTSPIPESATHSTHSDDMSIDGLDDPNNLGNPFGDILRLHATIHSEGRASKGIVRDFERHKLRNSLPNYARSPSTPRANSVSSASGLPSALHSHSAHLARRRKSQFRATGQLSTPTTPATPTPESAGVSRLYMPPVPIHRAFAKAHVPALAAVLMHGEIRRGDTIDLPMPFPGSWLETVAYMYTGNEDCFSERVKHNIWYLGGLPI